MKIATPLLLISLTLVTLAQIPDDPSAQRAFANVERVGEANARSFFPFSAGGRYFTIRHDGFGEINGVVFIKFRSFNLKMGGPGRLERLYTAEFGGDLMLAYEVASGRSGWGYVARFNPSTNTFRWITSVPSVNIGPGLIEGNYAYVTGQEFLSKLDLQTGKYVWQRTDLAKDYGSVFAQFGLPEINGSAIVFPEAGAKERTLQIDKATGQTVKGPSR